MPQRNSTEIKKFRKPEFKSKQDNRKRVNIMCTSLVATFIICWFPQHVWRLSRLRGISISEDKVTLTWFILLSQRNIFFMQNLCFLKYFSF